MQGPNLEDELNIDKATLQTLRELYSAKEEAVAREDFDEAKRLKVVIERIRGIAMHLGQLEDRKRAAIANEDFDAAKLIKAEIERLKRAAAQNPFERSNTMPAIETTKRIPSQPINPRITVGQTMRFQSGGNLFEDRKDAVFEDHPVPANKFPKPVEEPRQFVEEKKSSHED